MNTVRRHAAIIASGITLGALGTGWGLWIGEADVHDHQKEHRQATNCLRQLGKLSVTSEMPVSCIMRGVAYRRPPVYDEWDDVLEKPLLPSVDVVRSELYEELTDPKADLRLNEQIGMWGGVALGLIVALGSISDAEYRRRTASQRER
jgi:hypothetical protein